MGQTPTLINVPATMANRALRRLVDIGVGVAKTALVSYSSIFGAFIISPLVDFILGKIGDWIYVYVAQKTTFLIIDLQTLKEDTDMHSALLNLTEALTRFHEGVSDADVQKASKDADNAFNRLVRWDGSSTP